MPSGAASRMEPPAQADIPRRRAERLWQLVTALWAFNSGRRRRRRTASRRTLSPCCKHLDPGDGMLELSRLDVDGGLASVMRCATRTRMCCTSLKGKWLRHVRLTIYDYI